MAQADNVDIKNSRLYEDRGDWPDYVPQYENEENKV